MTRLKAEAEN